MAAADDTSALRRQILAIKDDVTALGTDIVGTHALAAKSLTRARAALFEAYTVLIGPPEEDDDDH